MQACRKDNAALKVCGFTIYHAIEESRKVGRDLRRLIVTVAGS